MPDRRSFLIGAGAGGFLAQQMPWAARAAIDATPSLQRAINMAAQNGHVFALSAGPTYVSQLNLPAKTHLVGADKTSRLVALGPGSLVTAETAEQVTIENVIFDGNGTAPGGTRGLLDLRGIGELRIVNCTIAHAAGYGLRLQSCGGRVEGVTFADIADVALLSLDGLGLSVVNNRVEDCGNNGIQIWRSEIGSDASSVRGNHIARIKARSGGDGPYGNGINVFRAMGVICEGNVISGCGFSAIRYNASSSGLISGNHCSDIGEVALYVEFGSLGAVVERNQVDGASSGISITNIDKRGHLATCNGNIIRNLGRPNPQRNGVYGIGIQVETDTVASNNQIDHALIGMRLGFGSALANVIATGNRISNCGIGIDVSIVPHTGPTSITRNSITGAKHGAIVGMEWHKIAVPDLIAAAGRYPQIAIAGNQVR